LPPVLIDSDARSVISLEGEIDIESAEELQAMIAAAIISRKDLQVDLSATTDLDVTVVQLLLCAAREADRTGKSFGVVQAPQHIRDSLREMGLDDFPAGVTSADDR
jgi:anti-anti-sigma factor